MASESSPQTPQRADNGIEQDNAFMAMCLQHINPDTKKVCESRWFILAILMTGKS